MKDELKQLANSIKECDASKPYIFISYSRHDAERVYPIVIDLQKLGYNIWIDTNGLEGHIGENWQQNALTKITARTCRAVFFMLSSNSLKSAPVFAEIMWSQKGDSIPRTHNGKFVTLKIINIDPDHDLADGTIENTVKDIISADATPLKPNDYLTMKNAQVIPKDLYEDGNLSQITDKGGLAYEFYKCLFIDKLGGGGNILLGSYQDIETIIKNIPPECKCTDCSTPASKPFIHPTEKPFTHPAEKAEQAISSPDTPVPEEGVLDLDGDIYEGAIKDGCPNGKGKLTMKDGTIYEGEFYGSPKNGKGTISYPSGSRKYTGEWANGLPNGQGVMEYTNKNNYFKGNFMDGSLDGENCEARYGKFGAEKVLYKGRFRDGKPQQCTAVHPNGNIYSGEFKDWLPSGQFVVKYPNGDTYTGELKDWLPNGQGVMEKISGQGYYLDVYEGNFTNGMLCDKHGILTKYKRNEDGSRGGQTDKYKGEIENNKKNGHGVEIYRNKYIYDGDFKDNEPNGHGVLTYPSGTVKEVVCKNGKFITS